MILVRVTADAPSIQPFIRPSARYLPLFIRRLQSHACPLGVPIFNRGRSRLSVKKSTSPSQALSCLQWNIAARIDVYAGISRFALDFNVSAVSLPLARSFSIRLRVIPSLSPILAVRVSV